MVVLALIGAVGWLLFQQTVQSQLRSVLQSKIAQQLSGTGLNIRIGHAQFIDHQGLRLGQVELSLTNDDLAAPTGSTFSVAELFVHVDSTLSELVTAGKLPPVDVIELRRAKLSLIRSNNGLWDFAPVINKLRQLQPAGDPPRSVQLVDCEIQLIDMSMPQQPPVVLSGIQVTLEEGLYQGRKQWQATGTFRTRAISKIGIEAFVDTERQRWLARLSAEDAQLSNRMMGRLPESARGLLAETRTLEGRIDFLASAEGDFHLQELPRFQLEGSVAGFSLDDARLPMAVFRTSAKFLVNNHGLSLTDVQGELEDGRFRFNYRQAGLLEREQWHCSGFATGLYFSSASRAASWLPEYGTKLCQDFSPEGSGNVKFVLSHDGQQLRRQITGQLTDMAFSFIKLPYRVEHCVGTVNWIDDRCDFEINTQLDQQAAQMTGFVDNIGQGATYQVDLDVPGTIPIDQKLLDAVDAQPKLANVVRAFRPLGRVGGSGRIEKRIANGEVTRDLTIRLANCAVRHEAFDYPISNIQGTVKVQDDHYTFQDLQGGNSSGKVGCHGTWDPFKGLDLRFLCQAVPLNDQLRYALKPEIQGIWNGFRPRGTLDLLKVDMTLPPGKQLDLQVEAVLKESSDDPEANYVSIYPVWFPYQLNHLTGKVRIGDGRITLTGMRGKHHKTWVACHGSGHYSEQSWSVGLRNLLVSSLKADEDLLTAVPRSLAIPLAHLRYQGLANVAGEITLAGTKTLTPNNSRAANAAGPIGASRTSMAWNIMVNMNQADMQIGLPLENVYGSVQLSGIYDGESVRCDGQLDVDSLTLYGTQITNVAGPFRIENDQVTAGKLVPLITSELAPDHGSAAAQVASAKSVTGVLHGGSLTMDARMLTRNENPFYLECKLIDACLGTTCRELGPGLKDIEGRSNGHLRLQGTSEGTYTLRGEGNVQLSDAKIYELPVVLALLKILNVGQVNRTAFDTGKIDFAIEGDTINLQKMEFNGDAISLIGNGLMSFDRDIDLNFYSVVGRNRLNIPLISDLYKASSQRVLWIKVDGKLDNPQTHRNVLPGVNDSLKQLLTGQRDRPARPFKDPLVRPAGY